MQCFSPLRVGFRTEVWFALSVSWEGNSQHSGELKQQTHFDVRSAGVFVGVIFVSLGGLFYICIKLLLVPVLLELSVLYVGSEREEVGWGFTC